MVALVFSLLLLPPSLSFSFPASFLGVCFFSFYILSTWFTHPPPRFHMLVTLKYAFPSSGHPYTTNYLKYLHLTYPSLSSTHWLLPPSMRLRYMDLLLMHLPLTPLFPSLFRIEARDFERKDGEWIVTLPKTLASPLFSWPNQLGFVLRYFIQKNKTCVANQNLPPEDSGRWVATFLWMFLWWVIGVLPPLK